MKSANVIPVPVTEHKVDNYKIAVNPTAHITFIDGHPVITLDNWNAISAVMIERASYEMHRASHQHRANMLQIENTEKQRLFKLTEADKENANG